MDLRDSEQAPDTGIFTLWFSCNYGAILTTFALYRLLEKEGLRPLVLDQAPMRGRPDWCEESSISRAFMRRRGLHCSAPLRTDEDVQQLNAQLDTFIVGSDQVWRWQYTRPYGLLHFLDFVRGDKRKIAVSSSFGIDREERPADSVRKAGYFLRSFDAVSVREESGLTLLEKHYGVQGEWIPDPVFLCDKACYDELTEANEVPQTPYLLSYVLEPDDSIRRLIETTAAERGLEVINIVDAEGDYEKLRTRFGGIGNIAKGVTPEQWVAYIRNCSFFVTDSFHGVSFSLIFHRPFLCVAPPVRGLARFTSLLKLTGLQRCLLSPDYSETERLAASEPIEWNDVLTRLEATREAGKSWLHHALTAPRSEARQAQAQLVYELVYAGNGASARNYDEETRVQQHLAHYSTSVLPRLILLKKLIFRLLSYCPLPSFRQHCLYRLNIQRRLAAYLKERRV